MIRRKNIPTQENSSRRVPVSHPSPLRIGIYWSPSLFAGISLYLVVLSPWSVVVLWVVVNGGGKCAAWTPDDIFPFLDRLVQTLLSTISSRPVAHWDIDSWQVRVTVADNHETTDSTDYRFQNLFAKDNCLGHQRTMLLPSWPPLMIHNWTCTGVWNWQFDISYNIMVRGEWDLFLGPLEWARAEVGGSTKEYWSGGNSQGLLLWIVNQRPPPVFHKKSTLNFKLSWVSCKFIETVRVSLKLRVEFLWKLYSQFQPHADSLKLCTFPSLVSVKMAVFW